MQPIDFFWRAAERWPQRIAIDAPGGCIRYDALARKVAALAAGLQARSPPCKAAWASARATAQTISPPCWR